jgi:hypothetical protein
MSAQLGGRFGKTLEHFQKQAARNSQHRRRDKGDGSGRASRVGEQCKFAQQRSASSNRQVLLTVRGVRFEAERTFLDNETGVRWIAGPEQNFAGRDVPALGADRENAQGWTAENPKGGYPLQECDVVLNGHSSAPDSEVRKPVCCPFDTNSRIKGALQNYASSVVLDL